MARSRNDSGFLADVELLCLMGDELERQGGECSFARIADELGIPASTLNSCRTRLENEVGVALFNTIPKSSRNTLTPSGKVFLNRARAAVARLQGLRRRPLEENAIVRFIASHSLLIHLFPSVIRRFLETQKRSTRSVTLQFEDHADLDTTISAVRGGEVDFAVLWDIDDRSKPVMNTGLVYYKFEKKLDLVVIFGHGHPFVERLNAPNPAPVKLEELAGETVLCLQGRRQPLYDWLPAPDSEAGGQTIILDHFSTIIEYLSAGHRGVAIVPGLYRELDYYRKTGNLYHLPIAPPPQQSDGDADQAKVSIIAIFRGQKIKQEDEKLSLADFHWPTKHLPAGELLLALDQYLVEDLTIASGWQINFKADGAGRAFDRMAEFHQGWYLWCENTGIDKPQWKHFSVDFAQPAPGDTTGTMLLGTGSIAGDPLTECGFRCDLMDKTMLQLRIEPRRANWTMLATFNMSCSDNGVEMIVGTWSGQDGKQKPLSGPILLHTGPRDKRLAPKTLLRFNRAAMLHVLGNVNLLADELAMATEGEKMGR